MPFGWRHSLLEPSCPRWGVGPRFRRSLGLPGLSPDPNGIAAFRTSETRSGWVLPVLRGRGVRARTASEVESTFGPLIALRNHLTGDPKLRSLIGSLLAFTRPIFPLPGSPGWFGSALGFTPLLSHASLPSACRGQGQDWTLSRAVTTSHVYSIWFRAASRRTCAGVSVLSILRL